MVNTSTKEIKMDEPSRASSLLALLDAACKVDPLPENNAEEERRDPPAATTSSYPEKTKDEWKGPSKSSFPVTLMNLLDDPNNSDVLSWLPNGTGFIITDPDKFATELMPRAFQVIRFPTFLKRLERWGFAQIRRPGHPEHGAYRHPNFRRGDMATCRDGIHFSRGSGSGKFAKAVQKAASHSNNKSSSMPSSRVPALSLRDALGHQLQQRQRQNHHGKHKDLFSQLQYTQRIKMQAAALQKSRAAVSAAAGGSPSSSVGEAATNNNKPNNPKQSHRSAHPAFALLPTISQGDVNKATKDIVAAAIASLKRDKILQQREKAMAAFLEKKKLRQQQQQQQQQQAENTTHQQQQQQQTRQQPQQQQKPNDISPENLNLMTSRLLSSSKCVNTKDNLAKMAKVVQLKSKIASLHQVEQLQLKEKQRQQIKLQQQQLKQQLQRQQQQQVQQQVTNKMIGAPPRVWNSAYAA